MSGATRSYPGGASGVLARGAGAGGGGRRPRRRAFRGAPSLLASVAAFALALAAVPTAAQETGTGARAQENDVGSYTSPTYGYTVEWDKGVWAIAGIGSADGIDTLRLASDRGTLDFEGLTRYEGDPRACARGTADARSRDAGVSGYVALRDEEGNRVAGTVDGRSFVVYRLTFVGEDGVEVERINHIECRTLFAGESVLATTLTVPLDDYEAELPLAEAVLASIQVPDEPPTPVADEETDEETDEAGETDDDADGEEAEDDPEEQDDEETDDTEDEADDDQTQDDEEDAEDGDGDESADGEDNAGGEIVVQDDFEDEDAGELSTRSPDPDLVSYAYDDGEFVIETLEEDAGGWQAGVPGTYTDATLAIDVRLAGEFEGRYVRIGCRFSFDDQAASEYSLLVDTETQYAALDLWDAGELTTLDSATLDEIEPGDGTNRLELSCVGETISARVNGALVGSVEDDTLDRGVFYIGAGTYTDVEGTFEARFDDLVVTVPADGAEDTEAEEDAEEDTSEEDEAEDDGDEEEVVSTADAARASRPRASFAFRSSTVPWAGADGPRVSRRQWAPPSPPQFRGAGNRGIDQPSGSPDR